MSLNLGSLLAESARRYRNETACVFGTERRTYDELDGLVRRFAAELRASGVRRGDRVMIMAPNTPAFTIAYFGTVYAGAVAVTAGTLQTADDVCFQLDDCGALALVLHQDCQQAGLGAFRRSGRCRLLYFITDAPGKQVPSEGIPFLDALGRSDHSDLVQTMADETAVILYTSGTTGQSKGAELTHFNLFANARILSERVFSRWPEEIHVMGPGQVGLAALPLYHVFGQTNAQNGMLFGGGTISYLKRFTSKAAVKAIKQDHVTAFSGVPTMYFAMLHDPECREADLSSLRFCISGGAPIPAGVKREFEQRFSLRIQEGYGLTETSPLATMQAIDETSKCGTVGKPVQGVEVKVFDEKDREVGQGEHGEIVIRGHNVMKGYHHQLQTTAEVMRGAWFHTGDIGYFDAQGDLFIVDRKKDMILRGGFNVCPREIEEVLYQHPAVIEAAVIGIPHPRHGEEIKAVIALKPRAGATADELIAYCKERLACYKYPRTVEFRAALPKGPTGKILKRPLRAQAFTD